MKKYKNEQHSVIAFTVQARSQGQNKYIMELYFYLEKETFTRFFKLRFDTHWGHLCAFQIRFDKCGYDFLQGSFGFIGQFSFGSDGLEKIGVVGTHMC